MFSGIGHFFYEDCFHQTLKGIAMVVDHMVFTDQVKHTYNHDANNAICNYYWAGAEKRRVKNLMHYLYQIKAT